MISVILNFVWIFVHDEDIYYQIIVKVLSWQYFIWILVVNRFNEYIRRFCVVVVFETAFGSKLSWSWLWSWILKSELAIFFQSNVFQKIKWIPMHHRIYEIWMMIVISICFQNPDKFVERLMISVILKFVWIFVHDEDIYYQVIVKV